MDRNIRFGIGRSITIPFVEDMVTIRKLTNLTDELILTAKDAARLNIAIAAAVEKICMLLGVSGAIQTDVAVQPGLIRSGMALRADNDVIASVEIGARGLEKLRMAVSAYARQPELLIEAAKTMAMSDGMRISATPAGAEVRANIAGVTDDLTIQTKDGVQIGPILTSLYGAEAMMRLAGDDHAEYRLALSLLDGEDGKIDLALRAVDGLHVKLTHPVVIGTLDPRTIGSLDPDPIPDATTEEI